VKLLDWIRAPFAWKVVRQFDGYTYPWECGNGSAAVPLDRQRLGPRRLHLHAHGRCLLRAVWPWGLWL